MIFFLTKLHTVAIVDFKMLVDYMTPYHIRYIETVNGNEHMYCGTYFRNNWTINLSSVWTMLQLIVVFLHSDNKLCVREELQTLTGLQVLCYLWTVHFAVYTMAAVALFLPAAAVRKLQPGVMASLPDTDDYKKGETEKETCWTFCGRKSAIMRVNQFWNSFLMRQWLRTLYTKATRWIELMSKSKKAEGRGCIYILGTGFLFFQADKCSGNRWSRPRRWLRRHRVKTGIRLCLWGKDSVLLTFFGVSLFAYVE